MGLKNSSNAPLYRYGKIVNLDSANSKRKTLPVFQHYNITKEGAEIVEQANEFEGYLFDMKVEEYEYQKQKKKSIYMFFKDEDGGPTWKVSMNPNSMSLRIINTLCNKVFENKMSSIKLRFSLWEGAPTPSYDNYSSNCSIRINDADETIKPAYDIKKIKEVAPVKEYEIKGQKVYDTTDLEEYFYKLIETVIKPRLNVDDTPIFNTPTPTPTPPAPQAQAEVGHSFVDDLPKPPTGTSFAERAAEYENSMAQPKVVEQNFDDGSDDLPF